MEKKLIKKETKQFMKIWMISEKKNYVKEQRKDLKQFVNIFMMKQKRNYTKVIRKKNCKKKVDNEAKEKECKAAKTRL